MLNVTMLMPSLSRRGGGIFDIGRRTAQELHRLDGVSVSAVGLADELSDQDRPAWAPLTAIVCRPLGPTLFGFAPSTLPALCRLEPDVVHQHGIWQLSSVQCMAWARLSGRPYLVTIHGMLDDWAVQNSSARKRLAMVAYQRRHLREAACLHVNTLREAEQVRSRGFSGPMCVIPNGVDVPAAEVAGEAPWADRIPSGRKVLLFLGRIHPKKGIENLLRAWAQLRRDAPAGALDWAVAVAGWDDGGHQAGFERLAAEIGLGESAVVFVGPLFGDAKELAFQHARAFALPSFSEGLPMAVLEAWAHRLPTLLTPECNLGQAVAAGAALEVAAEPQATAAGLGKLVEMSDGELAAMGQAGRDLVEQQFTWPGVAREMRQAYEWMTGDGVRPDSILMNR